MHKTLFLLCCFSSISALPGLNPSAYANGVLRDGYGSASMAMGGTGAAFTEDPLTAMAMNPATLSLLDAPRISLTLNGIQGNGQFTDSTGNSSGLGRDSGAFPELGIAYPLGNQAFTLGFAVKADSVRLADWRYLDAPGGVDGQTSYGLQKHQSEFTALSATLGMSWEATERLSLGMSVGLVYHRVGLEVPFIFQSQPTLLAWKTLLDLSTDGFGWNASVGAHYRISDALSLGLSYQTQTRLTGRGGASGDVSAQLASLGFADVDPAFRYRAKVETALPQTLTAGLSWQFHERARLALQVDWLAWNDAFDTLGVSLKNGTNAAVNGLTGGDDLHDTVPVGWRDRLVYRAGLAIDLSDDVQAQFGYSYGRSPVPAALTTPLNGSVFEHLLSTGVEWKRGPWTFGAAYQYNLPNTQGVGESGYRAGEYSHTSVEVSAHLLALSARYSF